MGCQPLPGELTSAPRPRSAFGRAHAKPTDRRADGVKADSRRRRWRVAPALRPAAHRSNLKIQLLPGDRLSCHRRYADRSANLMPASRHQDHTTSPSALATPVKRAAASTAPRPAFVTFAKRPSEWNRMAMDIEVIWVGGQAMLLKIRSEPKCRGAAYR
jgi:hypothetical protein